MKLIDNAREVFRKAWSWRWAAAGAAFSALDFVNQILPLLTDALPPKALSAAAAICGVAAVASRFLKQRNMTPEAP